MPTVLTDPTPTFYLIPIAFVAIAGAIAARNQDRPSFIRFGIALAVLLLVFAIDKLMESPREEAVRRIEAMAHAADAKSPDAFVAHIADEFEYVKGRERVKSSRDAIRNSQFWSMLRQLNVQVSVWDFSRNDVKQLDANAIEIGFNAKGDSGGTPFPLYVRATFKKQPDGQWKLTAFETFEFVNRAQPLAIPNFP